MKLRHCFALAVALLAAAPAAAWAQDQIHYLPPVHSRSTSSNNSLPDDLQLVITTNVAVPFDVVCETGDGTALAGSPYTVSANAPEVVSLGGAPSSEYPGFVSGAGSLNTVLDDAGIKCAAPAAFFVNLRMISEDSAQAASLTSKGRLALGTDFRTGHFKAEGDNDSNNLKSHFFSVMATEDNTTVNVTEIKEGIVFEGTTSGGVPATSEPITVTLDEGESYVVAYFFPDATAGTDDVNGTRITTSKPVAVNTGSWLGGAKTNNGGRDVAIDQTVPASRLRDEYIMYRGAVTTGGDAGQDANLERPLVVATTGNTDVFVNGSIVPKNGAPLAAGDYIFLELSDFDANGILFVELRDATTGDPAAGYLYQSTNAALNGNGPTMGVLPSLPCLSTNRVEIEDVGFFGNNVVQIVAAAGTVITVNDEAGPVVLPAPTNPTGTTDWEAYRLSSLTGGEVTVDGDQPFFVTVASEQSNRGVQATYTGFADAPLIIDPVALETDTVTYPVTLTLEQAVGIVPDGFQWFRNGVALAGETGNSLVVNEPGLYSVTGTTLTCGVTPRSLEVFLPGEIQLDKEVVSSVQTGDSTYEITYRLTAENFNAAAITGVQITDDLEQALAPLAPGAGFSIVAGPTASGDFAPGDLNVDYDGLTAGDIELLGTGVDLDSRERGVIEFTVEVDITQGIPTGVNEARFTEGTGTFESTSTATYPPPNPLNTTANLDSVENVAGDIWDLTYTIAITNESATLATNLQLLADLEAALGPLTTADWAIQVAPAAGGAFDAGDLNPAFDGETASILELLLAGVELAAGETGTVTFSVRIDVSGAEPTEALSVLGSADGFPTDVSDNPVSPDHLTIDGPDADADPTNDPTPADVDTDGDGTSDYVDTDDDNDGVDDDEDPARTDPDICGDTDADSCDDCAIGDDDTGPNNDSFPANDGTDTDSDGLCDIGDPDDDDDGVPDGTDPDPTDPGVCGDSDADTCDDCSSGTNDPANDGTDTDGDGLCDAGDPDDDDDGVPDGSDPDPGDPGVCGDSDADTCDDCSSGTNDPANDGPDADGDGICDAGEDADSDGVFDVADLDDDNDGIPDLFENLLGLDPNGDADGDDIPNYLDADDRGDGQPQTCATTTPGLCDAPGPDYDFDGDGAANHIDLDADNDGIPDVVEAGHDEEDADVDGLVDCASGVGLNGLCDDLETTPDSGTADYDSDGSGPDDARDTDDDGRPDFLDLDADGDGILDVVEGDSGCIDTTPADGRCDGADTDGDGIVDDLDGDGGFGDDTYAEAPDTDEDGTPDYRSLDADGDGIPDLVEGDAGCADTAPADGVCDGPDGDGDGVADDADAGIPNTDGDSQPDYRDLDSDDDGLLDEFEGEGDPDGDDVPNYRDLDSDDDGIVDLAEGDTGCIDTTPQDGVCDGPDADGDGVADDADRDAPPDTDGDGAPDVTDLDSDDDGAPDVVEGGSGCADEAPADAVCDGPDGDGDGIVDDVVVATPPDSDGDGVPDYRDLDSDDDGILDVVEVASGCDDADENGVCDGPDSDGDGIADSIDDDGTFGDPGSPEPADTDDDGDPDYIEIDSDGDGTPDIEGADCTDADPADDRCDGPDSDGDGVVDEIDGFEGHGVRADTDGDGVPDSVDLDDDNDGIPDTEEGDGALDTDGDGVPDSLDLDADDDGIPDVVEAGHDEADGDGDGTVDCAGGANGLCDDLETSPDSGTLDYEIADTDGDGVPDFQDIDSDDDGILDRIEGGSGCADSAVPLGVCDGPDSDGDGVPDSTDGTDGRGVGGYDAPPDTDGDGTPDYRDIDSDDDGIFDVEEGGRPGADTDNDGRVDGEDSDGDGAADPIDDRDGHGVEEVPELPDSDGDGTPDYQETDSDDDGLPDSEEGGTPGDRPDNDGDGVPDYQDDDSDNDGVEDGADNCRFDANGDQADQDGDGPGDVCDSDADGNGIADDLLVSGGGCAIRGSGDAPWSWLLVGLAISLASRRRRRRPGSGS